MAAPTRAVVCSAVHFVVAAGVYWHLITGGWLTNRYRLDDPNIVNLVLAIFEPIALVSVVAFWISRKRSAYRLMMILGCLQIMVAIGFAVLICVFAATWHFKLM
jgi:hypothetical protein